MKTSLQQNTTPAVFKTVRFLAKSIFVMLFFALITNRAKAQITSSADTVHVGDEVTYYLADNDVINEDDYHIDWWGGYNGIFTVVDSSTGFGNDYVTVKWNVTGNQGITADLIIDTNGDGSPYYIYEYYNVVVLP